ncbi:MAG: hypothetical protein ABIN91_22525 [Mucilaginibacter sp.]|uniref:hypothetical protein n=1 Tax=Mucilaginibacter sp. TaxID=1882438 RepID=UPI0032654460
MKKNQKIKTARTFCPHGPYSRPGVLSGLCALFLALFFVWIFLMIVLWLLFFAFALRIGADTGLWLRLVQYERKAWPLLSAATPK